MQRIILILSVLIPFLTSAAHAQARYPRTLYVTFDRAPVYDSASYLSNIAGELRIGDSVTVLGSAKKFFRILFNGGERYILGANIGEKRPAGAKVPKQKAPERGRSKPLSETAKDRGPSPVDSTVGGDGDRRADTLAAPTRRDGDASRQCNAVTKAGKRCSRATADPSGYCWQHGGRKVP
jgi:hypothetical protein